MDTTQSTGLVQSYFSHPDYLVVQCQVQNTILFPDSKTHAGPHVYHFVKFFPEGVDYTHEGIICNHIITMLDNIISCNLLLSPLILLDKLSIIVNNCHLAKMCYTEPTILYFWISNLCSISLIFSMLVSIFLILGFCTSVTYISAQAWI